jgi:cytochrome c oxidase subunit 1
MTRVMPRGAPLLETLAGTDHKRIGIGVGFVAFGFFLAGGVLALLMRTELAEPGLQVVSSSTYNALFTMHGSTMIYLFVVPVALAMGVYLVPLQVGASGIAGPRLALAAMWLLVLGGLTMWSGWLVQGGAAQATWSAFDPLSNAVNSPGKAMDSWIWGVVLATLAELILAACILATLLGRRTPGMTLLRMPIFCWTQLVTCLLTLFAFPVLIGALVALWIDRQWGGVFTGPSAPVTYQHLFWFYGHPVVYVMFFPFLGAVAEVIAVFSSRRLFGYRGMVLSLLVFASLSMSVWAHHMFTVPGVTTKYFALTSTLLVIPAGTEYLALLGTLHGGRIRLSVPMLFALAFLLQFLVGGLSGIWVASPALDNQANNSYVVVAHFHYTLLAGSVFGFFAGVYYWWPKVTGRLLGERLGRLHLALFVLGTNLTFAPQFALGEDGMPRRVADYPASTGWKTLNELSTLGAYVIAASVLVFLANALISRRYAGDDPWGGHTLEWATLSPPPRGNFEGPLPPIRSHAPLLDHVETA